MRRARKWHARTGRCRSSDRAHPVQGSQGAVRRHDRPAPDRHRQSGDRRQHREYVAALSAFTRRSDAHFRPCAAERRGATDGARRERGDHLQRPVRASASKARSRAPRKRSTRSRARCASRSTFRMPITCWFRACMCRSLSASRAMRRLRFRPRRCCFDPAARKSRLSSDDGAVAFKDVTIASDDGNVVADRLRPCDWRQSRP